MPTQVYACASDGEFDVHLSFKDDVPHTQACPACGKDSEHVLSVPLVKIEYTWNDKANDYQRNYYTMAKAQLNNTYHEQKEMGVELPKPTEQSIQRAAKSLHDNDKGS